VDKECVLAQNWDYYLGMAPSALDGAADASGRIGGTKSMKARGCALSGR